LFGRLECARIAVGDFQTMKAYCHNLLWSHR
jgi:hypothetical protein